MSVLLDENTKAIVQGITGHQGEFHTRAMLELGTKIVAGVTPGKDGTVVSGLKVYDDVKTAVGLTGATASVVFVPAQSTRDAVIEAIDAGIKLIVIITEHVPSHDMIDLLLYARMNEATIIGPNCPGIAAPGIGKLGIIPNSVLKQGNIGIISRSGTLTYEIVNAVSMAGLGESAVIGMGGDKIPGTNFIDALTVFEKDKKTEAVVLVGEIGGSAEEEAAAFVKTNFTKPVVGFVAGIYAPPGKRMGHAGAIISGNTGTAKSKIDAFKSAEIEVAKSPEDVPMLLKRLLR